MTSLYRHTQETKRRGTRGQNGRKYLARIGRRYYQLRPTWHPIAATDTCKSASMWSLYFIFYFTASPLLSSPLFLSLQEYIYFVAEGLLFLFLFCFSFSFSGLIKHLDILWMEENCMPCPPPSPSAADIACNHELTRSNSNASALTAENCLDTYRRSENATPVTMIFPSSFLYVALRLMIFYFFYIFWGFRCSYLNVMMCWWFGC